jgi:hypothetical protein
MKFLGRFAHLRLKWPDIYPDRDGPHRLTKSGQEHTIIENNPPTSVSAHRLGKQPITTASLPPAVLWAFLMGWRRAARQGYGRFRRISS